MVISRARSFLARGLRSALLVVALVLAVALPAAPAQAQMGMRGMNPAGMQTFITRRGVEDYARILKLDNDQKQAALDLAEGNRRAGRTLMKEMEGKVNSIMEKARDSGDWQGMQKEMAEMGRETQRRFKELDKTFFDDLRLLITDEQAENWPKVERARRREQLMRFSMVSGSSVNLIAIVENVTRQKEGAIPSANAEEVAGVLDRYDIELDRALVEFERRSIEAQDEMMRDGNMGFDPAKIQDMLKKFSSMAIVMRDLNRETTRRLVPLMSEDAGKALELEVLRRSFPRIYRQSHFEKQLAAAKGFADLEESQKESLRLLAESYARDAAAANSKWAAEVEKEETEKGGTVGVMMGGFMGGGGGKDNPVTLARQARRDLDKQAEDRLAAILSKDQMARLPEREPQQENPWSDMMPNEADYAEEAEEE